MKKSIDPVTVEIIGNLLLSIAEEMGISIIKSAYSTNMKERRDLSTAIFDPEGNMVAQAEHVAMHLGSLLGIIKEIIKKYSLENIKPGDMFIGNDPYNGGGTHLPDITVAIPVFFHSKLIAWAANCAHHSDVGGKVPGSCAGDANSIFQEGIKIPLVRVCKDNSINNDIIEFIMTNSRLPQERYGDLQAQVAANHVGAKRIIEAYKKYKNFLVDSMHELQIYTEKRLRSGIKNLPDGEYYFSDYLDDAGVAYQETIKICVKINIKGDSMIVDFTGTHEQVPGPINMTFNGLLATVFYSLKALIDPNIPSNAGIYRAFKVIAQPGLIISASNPFPVAERIDTAMRVADVLFGALAPAVPERAIAGCNSSCTTAIFSGHDPMDNELFYVYLETIAGGSGATKNLDGLSGVQVHMTNTSNLPIEALETEFPLILVKKYVLRKDSGGAGKFRGGLGIEREFESRFNNVTFTGLGDRQLIPPWGIEGGKNGLGGVYFLKRKGKKNVRLDSKTTNIILNKGDKIAILTPGSGGYGNPLERNPEAVLIDVIEEKVSIDNAKELYGVIISKKNGYKKIDVAKTAKFRMRKYLKKNDD
jgi:N-methylhydantoinase B